MPFGILGTGSAYPDRIMTNHDLEKMVDTNDEWIRTRSGVSERRIAAEDEATSDLAVRAGRKAIESAGLNPADIDLIIVCTFTPDHLTPSTACILMNRLGIPDCMAFDMNAACSGFVYGITVAHGLLENGVARRALIIGAESMSHFTNWKDRTTCVLFGDAAGAVVLGEVESGRGIIAEYMAADGRMSEHICVPAGGSRKPTTAEDIETGQNCIQMNGNEVFKFAVRIMPDALNEVFLRAHVDPKEVDWVIPHQANIRIIDGAVKRLGIPRDRFVVNIDRFGNTSAASVPLAMDEAVRDGRIQPGHLLGLVAFGGGLTWGAIALRF